MFELKITMEITGLPEALNNLADAITASTASAAASAAPAPVAAEPVAAPANVVVPYPTTTPAANPTMAAPAQPAQITPTVAPTPAPAPVQANAKTATAAPTVPATPVETTERGYTLEELSRAGAGLVDRGMMPQLCELLRKYGVQAVTMLDPSQYGALAADLKALGANL